MPHTAGWITAPELAGLLGKSYNAIKKLMRRGRYTQIKLVEANSRSRGGKIWQINISDPAIPQQARLEFYRSQASHAVGNEAPLVAPRVPSAPPHAQGGPPQRRREQGPSAALNLVRTTPEAAGDSAQALAATVAATSSNAEHRQGPEAPPALATATPAAVGDNAQASWFSSSFAYQDAERSQGQEPGFVGASAPAPAAVFSQLTEKDVDLEIYSAAPEFARRKADKYMQILKASAGLKGDELKDFIAEWNREHPTFTTSYPRVIEARKLYLEQGIAGLLAQYGKSAGNTSIKDDWFEYFKAAYLKEGAPSLKSCWVKAIGYAKKSEPELKINAFPSMKSFMRRLEKEVPKESIFMARHGEEAWNRKYANYIDRDYTNLLPGECFVGDHAQVDIAVALPNGKYCFPWVTAWRDFKTGKWVGWMHHAEAPNSDHVFQSFYYAVSQWGLPSDVYIDNGKDYRCRDFANGRPRFHKVGVDKDKAAPMLSLLGITPHFSLPYNAQAKTIERDFLKNKHWFSMHLPGYRGGDVTERPEKLATEIKTRKILPWAEYVELIDGFITGVLNKMPSKGKVLQGRCPDEAWAAEYKARKVVSKDALKLFCMRTSRPLTIMRNGVQDSEIGLKYWAEWMSGLKGVKVYLRRDINAYQDAWVFRAENDEYLGRAVIAETAAALAKTDLEKKRLKELMASKKAARKVARSFIKNNELPSPSEAVAHMAAGINALNEERGYAPNEEAEVNTLMLANTTMDKVVGRERQMQRAGTYDLSSIQPPARKEKKLYMWDHEKKADERRQREAKEQKDNG